MAALEDEGEKTLIKSTADVTQLRIVTFQVANVNMELRSLSTMVRTGNRVEFDTSRSYIVNKMTKDIMSLRERDCVYVVDMIAAP